MDESGLTLKLYYIDDGLRIRISTRDGQTVQYSSDKNGKRVETRE